MEKLQRKLTISEKLIYRIYDTVRYPEIRLSGKWLQDAGFKIGDEITLHLESDKLVITRNNGKVIPLTDPMQMA